MKMAASPTALAKQLTPVHTICVSFPRFRASSAWSTFSPIKFLNVMVLLCQRCEWVKILIMSNYLNPCLSFKITRRIPMSLFNILLNLRQANFLLELYPFCIKSIIMSQISARLSLVSISQICSSIRSICCLTLFKRWSARSASKCITAVAIAQNMMLMCKRW